MGGGGGGGGGYRGVCVMSLWGSIHTERCMNKLRHTVRESVRRNGVQREGGEKRML